MRGSSRTQIVGTNPFAESRHQICAAVDADVAPSHAQIPGAGFCAAVGADVARSAAQIRGWCRKRNKRAAEATRSLYDVICR